MAKKRKLKSKAVTIAPGKRYYGPPELRPSTKYKRGGKIAQHLEKGGTLKQFDKSKEIAERVTGRTREGEIKHGYKGYIDIEQAKYQMAKEAKTKTKVKAAKVKAVEVKAETKEPEKHGFLKRRWKETFPEGYGAPTETQKINRAKYEAMTKNEKIAYNLETVGMAAFAGGQAGYGLEMGLGALKGMGKAGQAFRGLKVQNMIDVKKWHKTASAADAFSTAVPSGEITRNAYKTIGKRIGKKIILESTKGATRITYNPKSAGLRIKALASLIKHKTADLLTVNKILGGMVISFWAKKEAPEPMKFMMADERERAELTGDWTEYDDLLDTSENLMKDFAGNPIAEFLLSAFPATGVPYNIGRAIAGWSHSLRIERNISDKIKEEQGQSVDQVWQARKEKEKEEQIIRDAMFQQGGQEQW